MPDKSGQTRIVAERIDASTISHQVGTSDDMDPEALRAKQDAILAHSGVLASMSNGRDKIRYMLLCGTEWEEKEAKDDASTGSGGHRGKGHGTETASGGKSSKGSGSKGSGTNAGGKGSKGIPAPAGKGNKGKGVGGQGKKGVQGVGGQGNPGTGGGGGCGGGGSGGGSSQGNGGGGGGGGSGQGTGPQANTLRGRGRPSLDFQAPSG